MNPPPEAGRPPFVVLVDAWLDDKSGRGGGIAINTSTAYRCDLALLADTIGELADRPGIVGGDLAAVDRRLGRIDIGDWNDENLAAAMARLVDRGSAPASRARALAAARGFSRWALRAGHLDTDPTIDFDNPKTREGLPVAFTRAELQRILVAAANPDPRHRITNPTRDIAIIAVLAGAGLRAGELCGLTVASVIRDPALRLRVRGKGKKVRVIPIAPSVVATIDSWLATRETLTNKALIFVRNTGRPLTPRDLTRLVDRWLEHAGVTPREGEAAHAFRHTYALGQIDNGTAVHELQALLGHAFMNTTAIYLRASAEGLSHAAAAAPIAGLLPSPDTPHRS